MLKSIKTAEVNRLIVAELTSKLGMGPENVIARIAFAYSLAQDKKLNLSAIKDKKGKEYSSKVLFGDYQDFYIALVCQHYAIHKSDINIPDYIKMHLDDGLESIKYIIEENSNLQLLDFIVEQIEKGLSIPN